MVLKSYFDGGNKVDPQFDRISLAVVCGTSNQWTRFNNDWKKMLHKHQAFSLHTTDAVALQNDFSVVNGWTKSRVDDFVSGCVDVIERHMAIPGDVPGKRPRMGLLPVTLTIPFDDWLRAKNTNPSIGDTIEEICATETLSFAFKWGKYIGARYYEMYFDRGENFFGHISDRYNHPKARTDIGLMSQVVHLGQSNASNVPALQVADLFAWGINHANKEKRGWHIRLHHLRWESFKLDYEHLREPSPKALELAAKWKFPKRRSSEKILNPKPTKQVP